MNMNVSVLSGQIRRVPILLSKVQTEMTNLTKCRAPLASSLFRVTPSSGSRRWKGDDTRDLTKSMPLKDMGTQGENQLDVDLTNVRVQVNDKEGKTFNIIGKVGDNLLYLAKKCEVEMEGACEASLACTTCHVYVDHDFLDLLPEATETEEDLLDQAPFLKENSRLGCQIILSKELDGLKVTLPAATKNFYVDGHKPTPH